MSDFRIEDFDFSKYKTNNVQNILVNVCREGNFDVVNWLFRNQAGLKIDANVFMNSVASGNIQLVTLILSKNPQISNMTSVIYGSRVTVNILDTAFITSLTNGHIELSEWLINYYPLLEVSTNNYQGFTNCCGQGHIEAAKWFVQKYPIVKESTAVEVAFAYSCANSHSEVANWLYTLKKLDIGYNNEYVFTLVCSKNNIDVAKGLFMIRPNIDITVNDYEPIRVAAKNNAIDIINWLKEFKPKVFEELKDASWISGFL
jgi:hypothetical protein